MCGIGGAVNLSLSPLRNAQGTVELMNDLLRHRGPDGEATWVHDRGVAAFAHRRLAIIDLNSGDQPMTDGASNWVTHNGEIYNYIELRGLLGKDRFTTSSDTEVILRLPRVGRRLPRPAARNVLVRALGRGDADALRRA